MTNLELLQRWRDGDRQALDQLVAAIHPLLHREVSKALDTRPRGVEESLDLVQTAVLNFLRWGPRFVPQSEAQLQALLKRIALNEVIDLQRRGARRSAGGHLESLASQSGSFSGFAPVQPSSQSPSREAQRSEDEGWVRLALQFLDADDRYLLLASEVEGRSWDSIAEELRLSSPDTARMRCARLKPRVAKLLVQLRRGKVPEDSPADPRLD